MRFLFVLASVLTCLLTLVLVVLIVIRAMGSENLVLPSFGLVVTTNTIIHLFIAFEAFMIGFLALVRKRLRSIT